MIMIKAPGNTRHITSEEVDAILKAEAPKKNAEFFASYGFNEQGKIYVVLGDTYPIKEELKALGCKYNSLFGWHAPQPVEGHECLELSADELGIYDEWGRYDFYGTIVSIMKEKLKEANRETTSGTPRPSK